MNPLVKVMNMVSLIALPIIIQYNISTAQPAVGWAVVVVCLAAMVWALWQSKRETEEMGQANEATK